LQSGAYALLNFKNKIEMTKREIIELYLADLNNLVPDSDAKRSRIIDLENELEALSQHDVSGRSEQLCSCSSKILPDGNIQFSLCRKCQIEMKEHNCH